MVVPSLINPFPRSTIPFVYCHTLVTEGSVGLGRSMLDPFLLAQNIEGMLLRCLRSPPILEPRKCELSPVVGQNLQNRERIERQTLPQKVRKSVAASLSLCS